MFDFEELEAFDQRVKGVVPDAEYVEKKGVKDVRAALQELIDDWNKNAPAYKKIYRLKVRETEFPKTPSKKIKRY